MIMVYNWNFYTLLVFIGINVNIGCDHYRLNLFDIKENGKCLIFKNKKIFDIEEWWKNFILKNDEKNSIWNSD